MEKTSNKVPRQRDPIDVICGIYNTSAQYICVAPDGSSACDIGRHSFEPAENWDCCSGTGYTDYKSVPCENKNCLAPRVARMT